jgi:hypothetical protein
MDEHKQYIETWKLLHADLWKRYANSPENEKTLIDGAQRFRPCLTAVDRSFARGSFVRTDGKTSEDDRTEAEHRRAAQEADLEQNCTITNEDFDYAASLTPHQVAETYQSNPEFARKYRKLIRDFGFQPVAIFARKG